MIDRRRILTLAGATGASTIAMPFVRPSWAQTGALRVGLLLPYSGTYAALGEAITNAMQLYVKQQGGKLGGREIAFVKVDDASEPAKAKYTLPPTLCFRASIRCISAGERI